MTEVATHLYRGLPALAATLVVLLAGRWLFLRTTPLTVEDDLLDQENPAAGVVFGAYLFGVAIALLGTHFGLRQDSALEMVGEILIEGAIAIALLRMSLWLNDRLILHRFCIVKEIRDDRNLGVAFCVAGSCLADGLVLNGALTGFSKNFAYGLRDTAIFWLLGQAAFVGGALCYHRLTRFDVHQLIEYDDNVAVGIGFGAFLASLGLVVRASVVGAGLGSLSTELSRSLLLAAVGVASVLGVQILGMLLVAPFVRYDEEVEMHGNVAMSVVTAGASLAIALLIAAVIQR